MGERERELPWRLLLVSSVWVGWDGWVGWVGLKGFGGEGGGKQRRRILSLLGEEGTKGLSLVHLVSTCRPRGAPHGHARPMSDDTLTGTAGAQAWLPC